jgi:4-hydroxybenzoate polyprenyltransferase
MAEHAAHRDNSKRDGTKSGSMAGRAASTPASGRAEPPLVVDLDRSLIRTDLLLETALVYLAANPLRLFKLIGWLMRGRAHVKRQLAHAAGLDLLLIPVNEQVEDFARAAKQAGREVYLATASDEHLANRIASRFEFLDGVIASDGSDNLKGARKAEVVRQRFPDGFDYVGDTGSDLHVWRHAGKAIVVAPNGSLLRSVRALGKPTEVVGCAKVGRALLKSLRLHQWAKNALVFVPAILSAQIANPATALTCVFAFVALGLVASGTYLINDLWDLSSDRRHANKRKRPLASGALPIMTALATAPLTIAAGLAIAATIGAGAFAALLVYLATTLAYSMHLKRVPVLDTVTLAGLFTLRLVLGIAAAGVMASPWLLVFSMFLFTSLSLAKRSSEIQRVATTGGVAVAGRGYLVADAPFVLALGMATATASIMIMVLYLIFDAFARDFYGNPHWLWVFPIVLFLWTARIWLVSQRGKMQDDPVAFALKDRQSLAMGAVVGAAFILAWVGMPL